MKRILTTLALALGILALGACAGMRSGAENGGRVDIEVQNNVAMLGSVTIRIADEGGAQRLLGTVSQEETRRFRSQAAPGGRYYLTADPTGGRTIRSHSFTIPSAGVTVTWNLNSNRVIVN